MPNVVSKCVDGVEALSTSAPLLVSVFEAFRERVGIMEMHHKLRRDPSWDPRGCNLCGQVGY